MRYLALLVCVACESPKAAPAPPPPPAVPDAAPAASLTVNGKPFTVGQAYIKRQAIEGTYQVYVSNQSSSCPELLDNVFIMKTGEETLIFDIGRRLAADGTMTASVTDVSFRGNGEVEPGSHATVTGSTDADGKAEVEVAYLAKALDKTYDVRGKLVATGCGPRRVDPSGVPKTPHPSTATVTIAGKKLPLRGAIRKEDNLVLSAQPKDCSPSTPFSEVVLERTFGSWSAHGMWLKDPIANSSMSDHGVQPETKDLKVTAGATGQSPDGLTVALTLAGSGTIEGYPIALEGTIEALDCPK